MGNFNENNEIIVTKANIDNFNNAGVWALFGKYKKNSECYCLQVAATINIKEEILTDKKLIKGNLEKNRPEKSYVNQFGEELFKYPDHPSAKEYLYSDYIKENFENLQFVVIYNEKDPKKDKKEIEREFAYQTRALCWRNGRPYKKGEEINLSKEGRQIKNIIEFVNDFKENLKI